MRKGKAYPLVIRFFYTTALSGLWCNMKNRLSGDTATSCLKARQVVWYISERQAVPNVLVIGDQGAKARHDCYFFTHLQQVLSRRLFSSITALGLLIFSVRYTAYKTGLTNCIR